MTKVPSADRVEGMIRVKLGPMVANFRGVARIERDTENKSGRIVGTGNDQRSHSSTQGEIRYRLLPVEQGAATRVEFSIGYSLRGMLAQVAREGLVQKLAARLIADFAANLDRQVSGIGGYGTRNEEKSLDGVAIALDLLRIRVWDSIRKIWHR